MTISLFRGKKDLSTKSTIQIRMDQQLDLDTHFHETMSWATIAIYLNMAVNLIVVIIGIAFVIFSFFNMVEKTMFLFQPFLVH